MKKRDWSEKMFQEKNLDDIISKINHKVEADATIISEHEGKAKWDTLSELSLITSEQEAKILQFISYIDEMLISEKDKINYIITLSSLVATEKFALEELDSGYIFIIVDFFKTRTMSDIKQWITLVNTKELISVIRNKTLENNVRSDAIGYMIDQYQKQGVTEEQKQAFLAQVIAELQAADYYQLLAIIYS